VNQIIRKAGAGLQVKIFESISKIDESQWNGISDPNFPFCLHAFLKNLEDSACVGPGTGWLPRYFCLFEGSELKLAAYSYIKHHSYGEYIFDWEWAHLYGQAGLDYYPKLLFAVPFTPATGHKILQAKNVSDKERYYFLSEIKEFGASKGVSGIHFLFTTPEDGKLLSQNDYEKRFSYQFHWKNNNYDKFSDFLGHLRRKRRKQIQTERKRIVDQDIQIRLVPPESLSPAHAEKFFQYYLSTISKKMSSPYLNLKFFNLCFENLKENILLFEAVKSGEVIANSLAFYRGKHLFGRYWGCRFEFDMLHFELCYYSMIEWAIENKMELFEAGAQGPHKHPRGFLPHLTESYHSLSNSSVAEIIYKYLGIERKQLELALEDVKESTPFRRDQ
jgi:hypothetical protein